MAFEASVHKSPGLKAGADLTADQFKLIDLDANGDGVLAGNGATVLGVLQNKPDSGQAAEVMELGTSKVLTGATFNEGDLLASDAAGKAVVATTGEITFGMAREASGAADTLITVALGSRGVAA